MYTEKKMYVSVCRHIAHKFWILNYSIFPNDMAYDFYKYCAYRIKVRYWSIYKAGLGNNSACSFENDLMLSCAWNDIHTPEPV